MSYMKQLKDQRDAKAKEMIGADGIVPSGEAVLAANRAGLDKKMFRDEIHMSYGMGRYLLGLVWFLTFTGSTDVCENTFRDFDEEISEDDVKLLKKIASDVVASKE